MGYRDGQAGDAHMRTAVYCATRNLYRDMLVSEKSLLYHNGADRVVCLIEDDALPEPVPACVEARNVSGQPWFPRDGPNYSKRWTYMILLRAAYTELFPECEKVLSLDVDSIVQRDLSGLWQTALSGKYYAAVREVINWNEPPHYGFGTVLMNLAALRDGTDRKIIDLLNTEDLYSPEQDAFGRVCAGYIAELPPEYCATCYNLQGVPQDKAAIRNFTNDTPLHNNVWYRKYARMSWREVMEGKDKH